MAGFWERLKNGMTRTRSGFGDRIRGLVMGREWSEDLWDELEAILYEADLGPEVVEILLGRLRSRLRHERARTAEEVLTVLRTVMAEMLAVGDTERRDPYQLTSDGPEVWMLVGVNGTGKTTTAGKLARQMSQRGHRVVLGAGDTFRAAAIEQLQEWGIRAGVEVVHQSPGADPAAVAFDTVRAAGARHLDLALIDTAGRLHNKAHLMEELKKVVRVIRRENPGAPHEVLLVIDATTGQNGLTQAAVFTEAVQVTGIVLTKLDGTAKGGVALAIAHHLQLPIRFVGVGESADDLLVFDPDSYLQAILGELHG
ncbi:MAG: signal recognition particle-docking protein FtsY [Thermaerobacter sp.]|nr:signal recognition particle-docking protein FtsY [Thermaerobacter sp.]